jgi:hypothetical protein
MICRGSAYVTIVLSTLLLGPGCGEGQVARTRLTLKDVETQVGIAFPTNTILLNSTDGGGRDTSYGFWAWGVFSPNAITMPPTKSPGVKDYVNLPLEDTTKFVQGMMRSGRLLQPQTALGSEWETNGYTFRGTLVRSAQGDYLVIEQFRKK